MSTPFFALVPDYLRAGLEKTEREDLMDFTLQLTKDFKALKVWMTFKAYGAEKLRQAIENDINVVRYFQAQRGVEAAAGSGDVACLVARLC